MKPQAISKFQGFPQETELFLKELGENNTKDWFNSHRAEYEKFFLTPALSFTETMGLALSKHIKGLEYKAKVDGSLFRLIRDVRFSKSKVPYKNHMGIVFWKGPYASRVQNPGFYFQLEPGTLFLAAGKWYFYDEQLHAYRSSLDSKDGKNLLKIIDKLPATHTITGEKLKKFPKGFSAEHPLGELAKHKGLYVEMKEDMGLPDIVYRAELIDYCLAFFTPAIDFVNWLAASTEKAAALKEG